MKDTDRFGEHERVSRPPPTGSLHEPRDAVWARALVEKAKNQERPELLRQIFQLIEKAAWNQNYNAVFHSTFADQHQHLAWLEMELEKRGYAVEKVSLSLQISWGVPELEGL